MDELDDAFAIQYDALDAGYGYLEAIASGKCRVEEGADDVALALCVALREGHINALRMLYVQTRALNNLKRALGPTFLNHLEGKR